MNDTTRWLDSVRGSDSIREVSRKIGTTHATLNRQAADDSLSFEIVRSISYAYGRPVLADLVATGHLAPSDVGFSEIENALHAATDEQLVLEVARRLNVKDIGIFDAPISEAVTTASNVVGHGRFQSTDVGGSDDDLEAVARPRDPDKGED